MNEYLESLATDFDPRDVRPVFEDRVLIKRLPLASEDRGLVIPESARRETGLVFGEVVSVGRGFTGRSKLKKDWTGDLVSVVVPFRPAGIETCSVKPGDTVLYERSKQHEFFMHGETYNFVFEEQFIAAIVERRRLKNYPKVQHRSK